MAKKLAKKSLRPQLHAYKGSQCAHCGKTVEEVRDEFVVFGGYFEFDHVDPSLKAENYDNLIRRTRLSSEILDEVDKCVMLCKGCHSILHAQNINARFCFFTTAKDGRSRQRGFRQWLKGQGIYSGKKKAVTFFSSEPPSIFPCWVAFKEHGKPHEPRRLTTFRVIEKHLFKSVMNKLQIGDAFGIWSYAGKVVAELSRLEDGRYQLRQLINFPLIKGEFDGDDGKIAMFVRRGYALFPNGEISTKGNITITFTGLSPVSE
jgi:hypothetical protein